MKYFRVVYPDQREGKPDFPAPEDWSLWEAVACSVRPLYPRQGRKSVSTPASSVISRTFRKNCHISCGDREALLKKENRSYALNAFDNTVYQKIIRKKLHLEARADLHGMTQGQAYSLLLHFLQSAQYYDLRYVLVITGKGSSSGSHGILRRTVPLWLETSPFRLYVQAFETAAQQHGGGGALYVRIRRLSPT